MFLKCNYDLYSASSGKTINQVRSGECFGSYTHNADVINWFRDHYMIFYTPDRMLLIKTDTTNYHYLPSKDRKVVVMDHTDGIKVTTDEAEKFYHWLKKFGLHIELLEPEVRPVEDVVVECRKIRGLTVRNVEYFGDTPNLTLNRYQLNLHDCKSVTEVKYNLFFSRYLAYRPNVQIVKKAFEVFDAGYLDEWDSMFYAELWYARYNKIAYYSEYCMFSRYQSPDKYETRDEYFKRVTQHATSYDRIRAGQVNTGEFRHQFATLNPKEFMEEYKKLK